MTSEVVIGSWPAGGSKNIDLEERVGDYTSQCDTANLGVVIDGEV